MAKRLLLILLLCLPAFVNSLMAQQEAQFTHNMFNNMGVNPGLAGLRNAICATGIARQQWVGFRDVEGNRINPETYILNVDAPIGLIRGGLALGFIQDQIGPETGVGVSLAYAYHLDLGMGRLGLGLRLGFLDKRIDFGYLEGLDPGDPALEGGEESTVFTDFSFGGFYMLDDEAWVGVSVTQLRQARGGLGESDFGLKRHLYAMGGYNLALPGNSAYVLSPSLLIKTDLASVQFDLNTLITYNNRFWGGVTYRPQDAVAILLGVKFDQVSVGYSYDITTSPLGAMSRSYGTHEIMLQYCFDLDLDRIQEIQRNIRFL